MPCSDLLVPDVTYQHNDVVTSLSYLAVINQQNYAQHRTNVDAVATIPLAEALIKASNSYAEFDEQRSQLFQQYQLTMQTQDMSTFYERRMPKAAFGAYNLCMGRNGFMARVERADAEFVSLALSWVNPPLAPTIVYLEMPFIEGATLASQLPTRLRTGSESIVQFKRNHGVPVPFRFSANVGGTSQEVFVPKFETVKPLLKLLLMEPIDVRSGDWVAIVNHAMFQCKVRLTGLWKNHAPDSVVSAAQGFFLAIVTPAGERREFSNDMQTHYVEAGGSAFFRCTDPELRDNDQVWEDWGTDRKKYERLFTQGPARYFLYGPPEMQLPG